MIARFLVWAAVVGLSAGAALAKDGQERGRTKWWQSETFKAELGLTAQQSADIEAVFQATVPKLRTQKEALDRLEDGLSKVIAAGTADEAKVSLKLDRVEQARGELSKTRTLMLYRMHRVLTAEQRTKLKALFEQRDREREERRRRD